MFVLKNITKENGDNFLEYLCSEFESLLFSYQCFCMQVLVPVEAKAACVVKVV